jgi:glycosyltransferase involved in cell wall biosynthesis
MRVALVSTPFVAVPPPGYGGTEMIVAELALALVARGVEVVVYATGDSQLPGVEIRSYFREAEWPPGRKIDRIHATWALRDIARDPRGFDVVHLHTPCGVEMSRLCPYPLIYTLHHDAEPELTEMFRRSPEVSLVGISHAQALREPARLPHIVHHGLDPKRFTSGADEGYLLFIGRYAPEKGVTQAIEVAARAGLPLVMAGEAHDAAYFEREVKPMIEKHGVREIGLVSGARKAALMAGARALLFPIQWEEPFGLVMIESLLSGVPVLALSRGSVPEIVEDGQTGAVCGDLEGLIAAARGSANRFDRAAIRRSAVLRWSSARMASDYFQLYRRLAAADPGLAAESA